MPADELLAIEVERARADPSNAFGSYVLLSELGRGGMGVVWRAWDEKLGRVVALKTLINSASDDARRRFRHEAEAIARLRHPNVVAVHECGEVEGRPFLTFDLIEGTTLDKVIANALPLRRAVEIMLQVSLAIARAHELGIIHRDLKPQNIMIDPSGQPLVLDLGLARVQGTSRVTKSGATLGTPSYMPPEQADEAGAADARSDVYSLGATLYHAITGRPPFIGLTAVNIIAAMIMSDAEPPSRLRPEAGGDLDAICARCLAKKPDERYASAAALARDLERWLAQPR